MAIGAVSPSETSGIASGARRNSISPGTLIGSRLVARIRSRAPPWRSGEQSGCVDDMLTIVEPNQHVTPTQEPHETWERVFGHDAAPERRCKSCRYQFAVGEGREIDDTYAIWQPRAHVVGNGQCDRGLADTSRARDGDQTLLRKSGRQRFYDFRSTEQPRH